MNTIEINLPDFGLRYTDEPAACLTQGKRKQKSGSVMPEQVNSERIGNMKKPAWLRPHLSFQLLWAVYLIWFFWLDAVVENPRFIIHAGLDDRIPFCEWFVIPYSSWFLLLAGVTALLWWNDTESYDRLVLTMFSGMFFCLIVYMILPNGLDLRPADPGRQNLAMTIMRLIWAADSPANVCPSIHCQSSGAMALAISHSRLAKKRPWLPVLAYAWAGLICVSTLFTKQHSVWDVVLGLALAAVWVPLVYRPKRTVGQLFSRRR